MKPLINWLTKKTRSASSGGFKKICFSNYLKNNLKKIKTVKTRYSHLLSGYFLILVPQPIYLGAEAFWVLTIGVIIGISFVGAIWGEDKWIEEWLNEPGYNDPDEFEVYKNPPPPKKEMETYDPEAEALNTELTWWEHWEEFWYSQWWWPRDEESVQDKMDALDTTPPELLPVREKDTRTWLVRWLDNATAELCKKPPEPTTKEEDMFDDLWDWTVSLYKKITAPTPPESPSSPTPLPAQKQPEEDEYEPETWVEAFTNFIKDRWWWRSIFGDDESPAWHNSYTSETDDDDTPPTAGNDDDDDDDDGSKKNFYFSTADDDDELDDDYVPSDYRAILVVVFLIGMMIM